MDWLTDPETWLALLTLTALEVVLGIDNVVFLSIVTSKLPPAQRRLGRRVGLLLAMVMRLALLFTVSAIAKLTEPLVAIPFFGVEFSGRDLILLGGGLFLIAKATVEIHHGMEGGAHRPEAKGAGFAAVVAQVVVLDLVFSLDSVITAVGMVDSFAVMAAAIVIAILVMMRFAGAIGTFIERHPTFKMLALSFLLLIGVALVGEGLELHIPKGYIYFAMAYSLGVELLNLRTQARSSGAVATRK